MCIFSRGVRHVGATRIFVGDRADGRQALIYAMEVELSAPTAMVLPLPTPAGCGEDAVAFVSLAAYPTLFDDLDRAFPAMDLALGFAPQAVGRGPAPRPANLVVHKVGAFVASFAPTAADLDRLDPQFRLSAAARAAVTRGRDGWSYAVVQLASARRERVHPIALTFPRRDPTALYVPTTHVHGDDLPATAAFDHTIYFQPAPALALATPATPTLGPIGDFVDLARTGGLIGPGPTFAQPIAGAHANDDVYLMLPPGVAAADLAGAGPSWEFRLAVRHGFDLEPGNGARRDLPTTQPHVDGVPPHLARWHHSARTRGHAVSAAIRAWCERFARDHAALMTPLTPALPAYYFNGPQLWSDTHAAKIPPGPGAIDFRAWSDRVEFQHVVVGVAAMPPAREVAAWRADLIQTIDAAAA